jgi:hypothetical protein
MPRAVIPSITDCGREKRGERGAGAQRKSRSVVRASHLQRDLLRRIQIRLVRLEHPLPVPRDLALVRKLRCEGKMIAGSRVGAEHRARRPRTSNDIMVSAPKMMSSATITNTFASAFTLSASASLISSSLVIVSAGDTGEVGSSSSSSSSAVWPIELKKEAVASKLVAISTSPKTCVELRRQMPRTTENTWGTARVARTMNKKPRPSERFFAYVKSPTLRGRGEGITRPPRVGTRLWRA